MNIALNSSLSFSFMVRSSFVLIHFLKILLCLQFIAISDCKVILICGEYIFFWQNCFHLAEVLTFIGLQIHYYMNTDRYVHKSFFLCVCEFLVIARVHWLRNKTNPILFFVSITFFSSQICERKTQCHPTKQ